jgi:hypothetical protein
MRAMPNEVKQRIESVIQQSYFPLNDTYLSQTAIDSEEVRLPRIA